MKKVLVVVDMQVDFVGGALGSSAAEAIVEPVVQRIKSAAEAGETIYVTLDTHGGDYLSSQEGKNLPIIHCAAGTPGHALDPRIEEALPESAIRFEKGGFASPELIGALVAESKADDLTIELVGLCTDICVVMNALMAKGTLPEAKIVVRSNLCAGLTPEKHEAALEVMRSCQIDVLI